jgi:mono/diheme cytochrome c family protein
MKILPGSAGLAMVALLVSACQTRLTSAPPVTESFIQAGVRQKADGPTLAAGRKLFLNRCIPCHALPDVARYDSERIPGIVHWMSERAHLDREQRDAVVKYLQTAKSSL